MRPILVPILLILATSLPLEAALTETDFDRALVRNCTACHTRERIDAARKEGVAFDVIEQKMVPQGARLNERDRKVLGTFWGEPMKKK